MSPFTLIFYDLPDGTKPVEEFLNDLDNKMFRKASDELRILRDNGPGLRKPYSKPIGNGLFELRIQQSNDIARIFYFFFAGRKIIATNGFIKKSRKAPEQEIERALKYKIEYESRLR